MLDWLLQPLGYEFMRNALAIGILVGILCPVMGSYLIVLRMTLLGDVIAHSVLPGLSISFFLGIDILIGAFCSGIFSSLLITWIRSQSRIKVDAAMALTFSSFFALGVTLITVLKNKLDLDSFLFGDILGVTLHDIGRTLIITVIILLLIKLFYKELLFYVFDKTGSQAVGLPTNVIYFGFMAAITLTIIASMQAVGVILVISLLVGPALSAYLLVNELHHMMGLGAIIGVFASITGVYLSYYCNIPSGPAIVLVSCVLFLVVLLLSPSQGILTRSSLAKNLARIFGQLGFLKRRK
ncbi:metal ABC transporter permease [Aetokthonos hydrillicola Thurmond2011]|jgi:manganese/iron transport system permease protein|uniref:Metal ABC transporter permease n=1 Tax=Aetokthonos hydrillicola Thurmond2011 TaxID=2712845 RepID=A0AAP5M7H4_9CYAN|nr:metal ABC transporter permease [Aetokthonos hydrillicola]MBO3457421.1 metal ABC transporter permease [Aetokthonos hydrillicola CCALA 1050]MBW4589438.1 metal ABC transporter permease [Aetokthonos hydrillicola CCALA 1050]MDR9893717.1 metal ABC transporter permease [Aetokthonos hydrillicola Thurmond2011]